MSKYYCKARTVVVLLPAFAGQAELPAEAPELSLLVRFEDGHRPGDALHVDGERAVDQVAPLLRQMHHLYPPIRLVPNAADETATFEVVDHGRDVAATPKDLLAELALLKWAQVL